VGAGCAARFVSALFGRTSIAELLRHQKNVHELLQPQHLQPPHPPAAAYALAASRCKGSVGALPERSSRRPSRDHNQT